MAAVTAVLPVAATTTCVTAVVDNPFTSWDNIEGTGLKTQFVFTYLDETDADQSLLQADSEISVWTTTEVNPSTAGTNVNTAAFVLVGAVQMTVAATSAIALALLF